MIGPVPTAGVAILTGLAAVWDARTRTIPNALSWVAMGFGAACLALGALPPTRLLWAAGTWAAYDVVASRWPQSLGYGDVKWATVLMGFLGAAGLPVLLGAHLGVVVWATVEWLAAGRRTLWTRLTGPWAPGAAVALGWMLATGLR